MEPKTVEWWEQQWNNLKKELDEINPKLDAAIKKHSDDAEAHKSEITKLQAYFDAEVAKVHETLQSKHAEEIAELKTILVKKVIEIQEQQKQDALDRLQIELDTKHKAELAALRSN